MMVIKMKDNTKVKKRNLPNTKYFSTNNLLDYGFSRYDIDKLLSSNKIEKVSHGLYIRTNTIEDFFSILQAKNKDTIFSNESALYLHNMTTAPANPYCITVEFSKKINKNAKYIREAMEEIKIYYVNKDVLYLGADEIEWNGNTLFVYDKERTICDILKNRNRIDPQVYFEGLQEYFVHNSDQIKFDKIANYAKQLGITSKIMDILNLYRSA